MKIKDILNESVAPQIAHYHVEADSDFDSFFNPQAAMIADKNREHYKKFFPEYFESGAVPVFEKEDNNEEHEDLEEWTSKPQKESPQSAGYRGQQNALHRAGVPHDEDVQAYNVQAYNLDLAINTSSLS